MVRPRRVRRKPAREASFGAAASRMCDGRGRSRGNLEIALRVVADEVESVRGRAVHETLQAVWGEPIDVEAALAALDRMLTGLAKTKAAARAVANGKV